MLPSPSSKPFFTQSVWASDIVAAQWQRWHRSWKTASWHCDDWLSPASTRVWNLMVCLPCRSLPSCTYSRPWCTLEAELPGALTWLVKILDPWKKRSNASFEKHRVELQALILGKDTSPIETQHSVRGQGRARMCASSGKRGCPVFPRNWAEVLWREETQLATKCAVPTPALSGAKCPRSVCIHCHAKLGDVQLWNLAAGFRIMGYSTMWFWFLIN